MEGRVDLTILTCDSCGGKLAALGVEPTRGRTRAELLEDVRRKGRVFEICRFCGKRSNLRVEPLVNRSKHLLLPPPSGRLP
jgi:ribosomal protein L37AE/L43A